VTILGMIILGGLIWAALHVTLAPTQCALLRAPLAAPTSNSSRC
jgi:hypothetical protein